MVCLGNEHRSFCHFASNYCILGSFVDHDGYSISSEGFLPTVVDIIQGAAAARVEEGLEELLHIQGQVGWL